MGVLLASLLLAGRHARRLDDLYALPFTVDLSTTATIYHPSGAQYPTFGQATQPGQTIGDGDEIFTGRSGTSLTRIYLTPGDPSSHYVDLSPNTDVKVCATPPSGGVGGIDQAYIYLVRGVVHAVGTTPIGIHDFTSRGGKRIIIRTDHATTAAKGTDFYVQSVELSITVSNGTGQYPVPVANDDGSGFSVPAGSKVSESNTSPDTTTYPVYQYVPGKGLVPRGGS